MTKHLQRDLTNLRKSILSLGTLVEEVTDMSIKSIRGGDRELMTDVLHREERINNMEVEIEEECLKILALHQPVAIDLRFIIVVLKVNNDLERMGDQAVNIIDRIQFLADQPPLPNEIDFEAMGAAARRMVELSLEALVNQDVDIARQVVDMDDELDHLHASTYRIIQDAMKADPNIINTAVSSLTISSNLERIGDLCTNIAEEVIFMEDGEIVRHRILGDNS